MDRSPLGGCRVVHNVTSLGHSCESQAVTVYVLVPPNNVGSARKVHRVIVVGFTIVVNTYGFHKVTNLETV